MQPRVGAYLRHPDTGELLGEVLAVHNGTTTVLTFGRAVTDELAVQPGSGIHLERGRNHATGLAWHESHNDPVLPVRRPQCREITIQLPTSTVAAFILWNDILAEVGGQLS